MLDTEYADRTECFDPAGEVRSRMSNREENAVTLGERFNG